MGSNQVGGWTEERSARAKALWTDGRSCSQIANALKDELGFGVSRNAVIGKLTRMGLSGKGHGSERKASKPRDVSSPPVLRLKAAPAAPVDAPTPRLSIAGNGMVFEAAPDAPLPPMEHHGATGIASRIFDPGFTSSGCKWPIGTPPAGFADEQFFCCGKREGDRRYCPAHLKIAISKTQPKRKDPGPMTGGKAFRFSGERRYAA